MTNGILLNQIALEKWRKLMKIVTLLDIAHLYQQFDDVFNLLDMTENPLNAISMKLVSFG